MQVILDSSFARRPGSAPIWGGKKVEFRDWTNSTKAVFLTGFADTSVQIYFMTRKSRQGKQVSS